MELHSETINQFYQEVFKLMAVQTKTDRVRVRDRQKQDIEKKLTPNTKTKPSKIKVGQRERK